MKKIVASVGLVAVGAAGLQGANAPGLTRMETAKPWSISASLRGFYDDNYTTGPSGFDRDSFGFEVSPSVALNLPMERTFIGASYTYSLRYYDDRSDDPTDQQHELVVRLDHKFSERYNLSFSDSFVYTQEPEIVDSGGTITSPLRSDTDVFRNHLRLSLRAEITEGFGLEPFYENTWYDYTDSGGATPTSSASRSALLDRFEHLIGIDGRYRVRRDLIALVGYQYGIVSYTGDEVIEIDPATLAETRSDDRDSTSHYFYVGVDHSISRKLSASARVGAQYTEYDAYDQSDWGPYAELRGTYEYLPGSSIQGGFRHMRNSTDVNVGTPGDPTLDQETSTLFGSVTHRITSRITGSIIGQAQHGVFNGGAADGDADNLFLVGLNLEYEINQHWSAETGYNYDRLDSDLPLRSFSRNRVYIGVRATY